MILLIVGCGRSGTTLLQRVLSSHPDINMVRETFFYSIINRKEMFNKKPDVGTEHIIKKLKKYWWMEEIVSDWNDLHQLIHKNRKANCRLDDVIFLSILEYKNLENNLTIIAEKTPEHFYEAQRLLNEIKDIKVVGMIRNPVYVLSSYKKLKNGPSFAPRVIDLWVDFLKVHMQLSPLKNYLLVKYEDLTETPERVLNSIQEFLCVNQYNLNSSKFLEKRIEYSPEQEHHINSSRLITANKKMPKINRVELAVIHLQLKQYRNDIGYDFNFKNVKGFHWLFYFFYFVVDFFNINIISRAHQYKKIYSVRKRQKRDINEKSVS